MKIVTLEEAKEGLSYTQKIKLEAQIDDLVSKYAEENIKFVGFLDEYKKRESKLVFECDQGHPIVRAYNGINSNKVKCKICRVNNYQEIADERIREYCEKNDLTFVRFTDDDHYTGALSSRIELKCNKCEYVFETRYAYLTLYPPLCKLCMGHKQGFDTEYPAVLYVIGIYDKNKIIGVKFGISKNLERRLMTIKANNPNSYTFKPLLEVPFDMGETAQELEDCLKEIFSCAPKLTKQQLPIGYTETLTPEYLPELLHCIHMYQR